MLLSGIGGATAQAETCARSDFEAVVDQASQTLVDMTRQNTPAFQAKLRTLRDKRRWTQEQFLSLGAEYVRDDQITTYDETSEQLLIRINTQAGGTADCRVLTELKGAMAKLVETQNAKWSYMFGKIDQELAK